MRHLEETGERIEERILEDTEKNVTVILKDTENNITVIFFKET